jgi:hypothetical protein
MQTPVKFNLENNKITNILNSNANAKILNLESSTPLINSDPVISYGLICYYKKKITVSEDNLNNNFFNKRTKKYGSKSNTIYGKKVYGISHNNISRIKILKHNEILNHTLKNMLGITSSYTDEDLSNDESLYHDKSLYHDESLLNNYIVNDTHINKDFNISEYNDKIENAEIQKEESHFEQAKSIQKEIMCNKVILVQRRNTIGFMEFMRGKYEVDNHNYIIKLFNMLTFDEKRLLREYDSFDVIRKIIGMGKEHRYGKEYNESRNKFESLKDHADGNMIHKLLDKSFTRWNSPEWGLPKGRKGGREYDIDCAVREFVEESGIKAKNLIVFRNIKPLEELYTGINGVVYKHIYYLAMLKDTDEARTNIDIVERGGQENFEVGNVKTFGLSECHRIIRPYYISKLNVIKKGFQIINCIDQYFE